MWKRNEEKGLAAPVRCKECRAKRKAEAAEKEKTIVEKTPEEKAQDFEDLMAKFKENTVLLEKEFEDRARK